MSLGRALPKVPAGRARHGKRLPQEGGTGTQSDPLINNSIPVSDTGATDPGTIGSTAGTDTGTGTGTGLNTGTGADPDIPPAGGAGGAKLPTQAGGVVSVTVVENGSGPFTTLGVQSATSPVRSVTSTSTVPEFSITSSVITSTPVQTSSASTQTSSASSSTLSSTSTSSPTGQSQQDASDSSATSASKGVSPAAIAGILIFVGIALVAALIYFIRRRMMAKRQQKRATWNANMYVKGSDSQMGPDREAAQGTSRFTSNAYAGSYLSEKPSTPPAIVTDFASSNIPSTLRPGRGLSPVSNGMSPTAYGASPASGLVPPTSNYNSGGAAYMSPSLAAPPATFATTGGGSERTAVVRCTYIPRLPDELSIQTGEQIIVNSQYDDGWALCTNGRGEQGVVPLECLNQTDNSAGQSGAGVGDVRRASSLRQVERF